MHKLQSNTPLSNRKSFIEGILEGALQERKETFQREMTQG